MRSLILLLLLSAACRPTDPSNACSQAGDPALLAIGTRDGDTVVPWTLDEAVAIEFGPQGGSHTWIDIAAEHLAETRAELTVRVDVEARFLDTGAEVPEEVTYTNAPFQCQAGNAMIADHVQVFVSGVGGVYGCRNPAVVTVTLGALTTSAEVTLVAPPGCSDAVP